MFAHLSANLINSVCHMLGMCVTPCDIVISRKRINQILVGVHHKCLFPLDRENDRRYRFAFSPALSSAPLTKDACDLHTR